MHTSVVARHMSLSDDERIHAEQEAQKLGKYFDGVNEVTLTFALEHDDVKAEIVCLVSGGKTLVAHESGSTVHASLELVADNMARQIKKHKSKLRDHRPHGVAGEEEEETEADDDIDVDVDDVLPEDDEPLEEYRAPA
jgi:ribosome hibernation promoting factor